ncbi:hypothetical protein D3C77_136120 [compost metagenome]
MVLLELLLQLVGQRLATAHDLAQRGTGRQLAGGNKGLQHRRHEVQRADALLDDHLAQPRRITVRARRGHDQRGAGKPRPEELPHRHVETERGFLQHPVAAIKAIFVLHPLQAVEQPGVMIANALGPPRGTGGVDAVGQALRRVVDGGWRRRLAVGLGPVAVKAPDRRGAGRQAFEQGLLGEQQRHIAVLDHKGQAVGRVVRVERQVGTARLENGEQGDGQLCRTLGEYPHAHVAAHAAAAQPVRQAVGTGLKLGIGELALTVNQRTGLRGALGLAADQFWQHRRLAVVTRGGVPALQQLRALRAGQQGQALQGLLRCLGNGLQQAQEVPAQANDGVALEQVGGVAEAAEQLAVGTLAGVQHQIELGAAPYCGKRLDGQPRQRQVGQAVDPVVVEQHLEQRVVTEAALRLQGFDQLLERQVLIGLGVQHVLAALGQQPVERGLRVDLQAQYLGVDEEAHQALGFLLLAATDGQADAQVALAAVTHQQGTEGRQQQHEQRAALLQRQALQLLRQGRRHREVDGVATEALLRRTRVVQGQLQQRMLSAQVLAPVRQLAFAFATGQPLPLPHGKVGVLDRQRRQLRDRASEPGAVTDGEFIQQHLHRGPVGNDVMQGKQHHVLVCRQLYQAHAHQRPGGQVEAVAALLGDPPRQLCFTGIGRQVLQADLGKDQRQVVDHPLAHLLAIVLEHRAQRRVACLQLAERGLQGSRIQRAAQAQAARQVIGRAIGRQFPQEPQALLVERQRRAVGMRRGVQCRRRTSARGLCQCSRQVTQARGVEHLAHGHLKPQALLQPCHHLHGQQRMTAQLEEVILRTHVRQAQHFTPDLRQLLLVLALGGLVALAVALPHRFGQLVTVQFAVGVARQLRHHHDSRRHHVVRQLRAQQATQFSAQLFIVRRDIGHQLLAGEGFAGHHQGLAHPRVGAQACFDLAWLDTKTTDLDLVVDPSQVVKDAIGALAHQVAGAVQAPTGGAERVGHKAFGSQSRALEIAPGQAVATQVELAANAGRHRVQVGVQDPDTARADAIANRRVTGLALVGRAGLPDHRRDHRLGRPVAIDDPRRAQHLANLLETGVRHRIATKAVDPHRRHVLAALGMFGNLLQIGRRKRRDGDPVAAHGLVGLLRRPQAVIAQHQAGAVGQGREPAFVGAVEGKGHEVQFTVGRRHFVARADGPAVHGQWAMRHRYPFGQAGGAGGVDQVGKIIGMGGNRRCLLGQAVQVQQVQVQPPGAFGQRRPARVAAVAQQPGQARVTDLIGQALLGVIEVQRHIGRTALEHRQQRHQQPWRTRQADPHAALRADATGVQVAGQLIGLALKLGKAQHLLAAAYRRGVRGAGGPVGDAPVHQLLALGAGRQRVPGLQLLPGRRLVQVEIAQARLRALGDLCQQRLEMPAPAFNARCAEQVGGVAEFTQQATGGILGGVQGQVAIHRAHDRRQRLHGHAVQCLQGSAVVPLVVVDHLEKWVVAEAALWRERLYQLLERQVLVGLVGQCALAHPRQQSLEGLAPVQFRAHHQGVDEKADQPFAFAVATAGNGHADAQVVLPAVAIQLHLERGQQQHEQRRAAGLGDLAQAPGQRRFDLEAQHRALAAGARRPLAVERQFQGRRFTGQALQPVFALAFALAGVQQLALPGRAIGIVCGQRRQIRRHTVAMAVVAAGELVHQQVHRPTIGNDVVYTQQQQMLIGRQAQQGHAHQRPVGQVVRGNGAGHVQRLGALLARLGLQRAQVFKRDVQLDPGFDQQVRLTVHVLEAAAQVFVAGENVAQGIADGFAVQLAGQAHRTVQVVGGRLGVELPDEPLAALRGRQCQGTVTRQAGYRQAAQVDTRCRQLGEKHLLLVLRQLCQAHTDRLQLTVLRRYLGVEDTTHSACSSSCNKSFMKSSSRPPSAASGTPSSCAARAPTLG